MEITTSLVFPVTNEQVSAFRTWANNTYGTYESYLGAINEPTLDMYIRTHILPPEMESILREAEPYIRVRLLDIHIRRLQLNRKRILKKIKYMKDKLGKLAFPGEAARVRIDRRAAVSTRRLQQDQYFVEYIEAILMGLQFPFPQFTPEIKTPIIIKKTLSKEDAETCVMDDDCAICLANHKMTDACTINCGHQFGRVCLSKWTNNTCPLCRTTVTEITEFVEDLV